jgi:small subunit ribosomal protein S20
MRAHGRNEQVANTKSAIKRMRQNETRRLRNRTIRSQVRTAVKTARTTQGGDLRTAVAEAIRSLDKAVTKGVIHRNTAARKKSSLARRLAAAK